MVDVRGSEDQKISRKGIRESENQGEGRLKEEGKGKMKERFLNDSEIDMMPNATKEEIRETRKEVTEQLNDPVHKDKIDDFVMLEQCAEMIIRVLDKPAQDFIKEVSQIILHVPLWQLIAGHLRLAMDRGELQAPWLDPSWSERSSSLTLTEVVCSNCNESFLPTRLGQVYCCNDCSAGKG